MVRNSIRFLTHAVLVASVLVSAQLTAPAQTRMPQMSFKDRTLANGMRALSVSDSSSPTVAIQVWYHVGCKDDPQKRSGFAHRFEEIMIKSTKKMTSEMMERLTMELDGFNNALTNDDVSVYCEVVQSNYLETLL